MMSHRPDQHSLFVADTQYLDFVGPGSFYGFMAEHGRELFLDDEFAELYCPDNGRPSVPPGSLAMALLLQAHDRVSDAEGDRAGSLRHEVEGGAGHRDGSAPVREDHLVAFPGAVGDSRPGAGGLSAQPGVCASAGLCEGWEDASGAGQHDGFGPRQGGLAGLPALCRMRNRQATARPLHHAASRRRDAPAGAGFGED